MNSPDGLTANGSIAAANFDSIMNFDTPLPHGVSDTYAYQLIESDLLDTPSTLNTTVDGFIGGLECESSSVTDFVCNYTRTIIDPFHSTNFPLTTSSCTFDFVPGQIIPVQPVDGVHTVGFMSGKCNGSDHNDDQRLGIIAAVLGSQKEGIFTIAKSNLLICTPTYQILPLDLIAQGPDRILRPSSSSGRNSRVLSKLHSWDIMSSNLVEVSRWLPDSDSRAVKISNQTVWFDLWGYHAYQLANRSGEPPALAAIFDDPIRFTEFFSNYFQQYSALLAHTSLMQPASISSEGSVDEAANRFLGNSQVLLNFRVQNNHQNPN